MGVKLTPGTYTHHSQPTIDKPIDTRLALTRVTMILLFHTLVHIPVHIISQPVNTHYHHDQKPVHLLNLQDLEEEFLELQVDKFIEGKGFALNVILLTKYAVEDPELHLCIDNADR